MNRNSHEECQKKINRLYTANQDLARENSKIFKLLETSENKIKTLARALKLMNNEFYIGVEESDRCSDEVVNIFINRAEKEIDNERYTNR